jgi:hypothetical protein
LGNLSNLLKNPTSQVDTVAALVEAVLLDEETEGSGSVTSVALTMPAEFSVAGSPVTTAGTLAVTKATQTANKVYAGPATGSPAAPTFRALAAADLPEATSSAFGAVKPDNSTVTIAAGVISANSNALLTPGTIYSVAGTPLPAASSALLGARAVVSDATLPTYLAAYTGGGAVVCPVFCNGTAWVTA